MYATPFKPLLGELLVELGTIRRDQLSRALAEQRRGEERLGETLIRLGMARAEDLAGALREQKKRWVAASFGAVMMAIHPFAVFARSTTSQMRVSVTVENSAVVNTQLKSGTFNRGDGIALACARDMLAHVTVSKVSIQPLGAGAAAQQSVYVPPPPSYAMTMKAVSQQAVNCGPGGAPLTVPTTTSGSGPVNVQIAY